MAAAAADTDDDDDDVVFRLAEIRPHFTCARYKYIKVVFRLVWAKGGVMT